MTSSLSCADANADKLVFLPQRLFRARVWPLGNEFWDFMGKCKLPIVSSGSNYSYITITAMPICLSANNNKPWSVIEPPLTVNFDALQDEMNDGKTNKPW